MTTPAHTPGGTPERPVAPGTRRCSARRSNGQPCKNRPLIGATVCRVHGGSAPQVKAAAARRLAESKARRALDDVGVREVDNPLHELRALTGEVVAWKDALANHVAALEDRYRYSDAKGAEQLRAEVALYERAMDRAAKLLETWARLGLDAMLAEADLRVRDAQRDALVRGLEAYRAAAGVDDTAHRVGLDAMAEAMRGAA